MGPFVGLSVSQASGMADDRDQCSLVFLYQVL